MAMQEIIVDLPASGAPPLVAETFDRRTILEMEIALATACEVLAPELVSHEARCYVASRILQRVNAGERTFGGMVSAGMAAVEALRCHREQV